MKRTSNASTVIAVICLYLTTACWVLAQQKSAGGNSQNSSPPSANGGGGNQTQGNNAGGNSPGITNGSIAIESVIFAYKALAEEARQIEQGIRPTVDGHTVLIATPQDLATIVQWRSVMYQATLLHDRAYAANAALTAIPIPDFFPGVPKNVPKLGGAFISSPSDVQTLIQTLASIFAVNESVSVSTGALTTTPLSNLVAGDLRKDGISAYIPSVYPSNLLRRSDLTDTFIGDKLGTLETDREQLVELSQRYSQALADVQTILSSNGPGVSISNLSPAKGPVGTAVEIDGTGFGDAQNGSTVTFNGVVAHPTSWSNTTISTPVPAGATTGNVVVTVGGQPSKGFKFTINAAAGPATPAPPPSPTYTPDQKTAAANFNAMYAQTINLKVAAIATIVASIDTFEATLFTGQPGAAQSQGPQQNQQNQNANANAAQNSANGGNPPAGPAANPVPPLNAGGANQANTNAGNNQPPSMPQNQNAGGQQPAVNGSPLQQILPADLLAHQIWNGDNPPSIADLDALHILILQTLESGGNQLTKSNLFLGSRVYFSGGAVATFSLFGVNGNLECGGFSYGYGGYKKDDKFMETFKNDPRENPRVKTEANCSALRPPPPTSAKQ